MGLGWIRQLITFRRAVCHPSTSTSLAHKATQLLRRLIEHRADPWTLPAPVISAESLSHELSKLGVEPGLFRLASQEKEEASGTEVDELAAEGEAEAGEDEVVSVVRRNAAVERWCAVLSACLHAK